MKDYNFNFEITKNIKMFESALDDIQIRRYDDVTGRMTDKIIVNVLYGPKSRILHDINGKPDTIKFPVVAVTMTGMERDNDRVKNKTDSINYTTRDGKIISLKATPWNIQLQVTILAKYQLDVDQIIQNFAVQANPYFVYDIQEPLTGRKESVEVLWDQSISIDYPGGQSDLPGNSPFRLTATTNFTIKTWLFKTSVEQEKRICCIYDDIIPTDKFFCDYNEMSAYIADHEKLSYQLLGTPHLRFVDDYYFKAGDSPSIKIYGEGFNNTYAIFVSGSNPAMYPGSVNYVPGSAIGDMTVLNGYLVNNYQIISPTELLFTLPAPSAYGFIDVVAVNSCGYGKLTEGANRCNRDMNPYPLSSADYNNWCLQQYPYLNGLVISNNLNNLSSIDYTIPILAFNRNELYMSGVSGNCAGSFEVKTLAHPVLTAEIIDFVPSVSAIALDIINDFVFNTNGYVPLSGGTMRPGAAISFSNGSSIQQGSFDNMHGGSDGISLFCTVNYELNWQAGHLCNYYNGYVPIILDSSLQFSGTSMILDQNGSIAIDPSDRILIDTTGVNNIAWASTSNNSYGARYWFDGDNNNRLTGDGNGLTNDNLSSVYTTVNDNSALWGTGGIMPTATGLTIFEEVSSTGGINAVTYVYGLQPIDQIDNIDVALIASGTGATLAQIPDGTDTGGNKRGEFSTDWQKQRFDRSQVASGNYSNIVGGFGNTVSSDYSVIAGGAVNVVSGIFGTIGGGLYNTVTDEFSTIAGGGGNTAGTYSFIGGGYQNTAYQYSVIAGGSNNTATISSASIPGGTGAIADRYGMEAKASFSFDGIYGNAQQIHFTLYGQSYNSSVNLSLDGIDSESNRYITSQNKVSLFNIQLVGIDDLFNTSQLNRKILVKNIGNMDYISTSEIIGTDDLAAGNALFQLDGDSRFVISGYSNDGLTTRWMATVYGVEISQPPPKQWTAYNSCYNNSINSGGYNVYTTYSTSSIGVSVTLYSDNNLLTTLSNQLLSYNNTWYMTAENGTIISSLSCGPSIPFTVYGNCNDAANQTNSFTIYISNFYNALDDGAIIYSDSNLTTPHAADIIYNGMVYSVNFDGMIVDSAVCGSVSWTMFNTCSDYKTNTNPVTIYTAFTNNITLGTVLYVDSGLTITQNGNVIYNGNILSPDSGTIVYINPCVLSWTAYNSCSAYENATNSFELYTNSSDNSLQVGATVYSDINTNVPRTVTFINNSTIFDVNGSGAITDLTKCLYQFNANDTACGLANNVIYYTDHLPLSIGISYVYTSNGNTPASNTTIYVYGDSSYYTTDAGGIVNAINTCPS